MTRARLNRMMAADGRCFDVAIDHGLFGEPRFLDGIEDAAAAIRTVVEAGPDALQLSPGQAPLLQAIPGPDKPALVLRTDVANVYGKDLPRTLFSIAIDDVVEKAVRLDAACLCVNLFDLEGEPEVHQACVRNVARLRAESERYGMPLMVEPLAMRRGSAGYGVNGDVQSIRSLVRQGVELGADVIKADPTDDVADYGQVIQAAGRVPVLVRGGGKVSDREIFERTRTVMDQGANGIVYGRNVIQHQNPGAMTRALMAIVHDGADADGAESILRGRA